MYMHKFYQNIPHGRRDRTSFPFSEFGHRQSLDQDRSVSLFKYSDLGEKLSMSMCLQNFIKLFHMVQEIGPVLLFQNSDLGKASTKINGIWQYLGLDHVNIIVFAKFDQNIPNGSGVMASFANWQRTDYFGHRNCKLKQRAIIVHRPKVDLLCQPSYYGSCSFDCCRMKMTLNA